MNGRKQLHCSLHLTACAPRHRPPGTPDTAHDVNITQGSELFTDNFFPEFTVAPFKSLSAVFTRGNETRQIYRHVMASPFEESSQMDNFFISFLLKTVQTNFLLKVNRMSE